MNSQMTSPNFLSPSFGPTLMARGSFGAVPRRRAPIWICTEEFEFLDLLDSGVAAFLVESVILRLSLSGGGPP